MTATRPQELEFNYEIAWPPAGNRPGHHESLPRGDGFRFREHLPLLRDPDARRIDLNATLRDPFGEIKVRTFRARQAITVNVIADVSASMAFGSKWQLLCGFSAAAARSAYRTGDRFGFLAAGRAPLDELRVPPGRLRGQAVLLTDRLAVFAPGDDSSEGLIAAAAEIGRRRSMVFLISDFHAPLPQIRGLLDSLAQHALIPVVVWDRAEFEIPDRRGWYEVRDMESGARRTLWQRQKWTDRIARSVRQRQLDLQSVFLDAGTRPLVLGAPFDANQVTDYFAGGGMCPDVAQ